LNPPTWNHSTFDSYWDFDVVPFEPMIKFGVLPTASKQSYLFWKPKMKTNIHALSMSFCVAMLTCGIGCAQKVKSKATTAGANSTTKSKVIVDTAVAAGDFKTLATALEAAGLVETLEGKGRFTVFAPTDAAFAKLPKETLADLLKPANKAKLTKILTYHVLPQKELGADLAKMKMAKTVEGSEHKLLDKDGKLIVGTAHVGKSDIMCSNGVIYGVDTVLMPE
jgi:uncharacterized surface protein with fasciclin (FAS1) repeats